MDAQDGRAPGRSASGASKSAARVRFVVPTSISFAPGPPDDLRDPHAAADLDELAARHGDARPRPARPTASATAAALLFVTSASSAPVSAIEVLLGRAEARAAAAGRAVELEQQVARRRPRRPRATPRAATARGPRFVWTITPVALMTGTRRPLAEHREPRGDPGRDRRRSAPPPAPAAPARRRRPRARRSRPHRRWAVAVGRWASSALGLRGENGRGPMESRSPRPHRSSRRGIIIPT